MAIQFYLFLFLFFFNSSHLITTSAQSDTYIIHMDLSAMPTAFSGHHNWYLATLSSTTNGGDATSLAKIIYTYSNVMHGFSAILSPAELEAIKNSPGYVSSIRDMALTVDTTHSSQFLGLNANSGAWAVSNLGKDVIIGLIDTGVWPESESYNDDGMPEIPARWKGECESGTQFNSILCNKKLIGARYFNKGLVAKFPNITIAMNSTRDEEGHGTHTSSTAAGNFVKGASYFGYAYGTASGMAPRAHIAMYKALWKEGVYSSDIIAAIDQAISDGVDVLSMSLGLDGVALYEDPIAIATFAAMEKGIFVSTSAGNEGPYLETLHNGTPWVLTVAAGTLDREYAAEIILGDEVSVTGLSLYPVAASVVQIPIVFMDACDNVTELKTVSNKIVACLDTNDSVSDQFNNIQSAKVTGAVFISNYSDLEFFIQTSFPAMFLAPEIGQTIIDYITQTSEPKATIEFRKTRLGIKPAPKVASYSSRGPSPSCPHVLKPDLMAPGSLILASWPKATEVEVLPDSRKLFSDFNLLSGTSMSCPHAAGLAVLLKGAHPDWSSAAIRSAMMTTSDSIDNTLNPIKDMGGNDDPATPLALGAGHVNPNKALYPGLIYDAEPVDYVNLLCALNYTTAQIKTITRSNSFNCSNPSSDLNYPSFIAFFKNNSKSDSNLVREFRRTVTNVGDGPITYTAKLTPIDGFEVTIVPDKLVFREKFEKLSYKLSIQGPKIMEKFVYSGYVSWVDLDGKYVVKSPIVATSLSMEALSG